MQVFLAGYNVDADLIKEGTPETLSAAYARISRDPRPVNELRKIAREEVEKARKSNSTIIFKMGHHSVAEHAVFNFDILDVSRLAMEEIEKFRLCSYTEKSQRYQKLEGNYVIPDEIRGLPAGRQGTGDEGRGKRIIEKQNAYYQELIGKGIEPEDARYVTSMATCGQLGMTINARNLELLIRRFASSPLSEVRELGKKMYELAAKIAPSIILFTAANDFDQKTYPELREMVKGKWERKRKISQPCVLVDYTRNADLKLVASLLHTSTGVSYMNCLRMAKDMKKRQREEMVRSACSHMEFYDATLREFEHIYLTFDLIMSSGCFAQFKRHRMATITCQPYDPALGVTVPPSIKEIGEEKKFLEIVKKAEAENSPYLLTGAHRRRVLMTVNARELYHLSRLREDKHAQWDIQDISTRMTKYAKEVMPLTMLLIGGKDHYPEIYKKVYGKLPKMLPPEEPK